MPVALTRLANVTLGRSSIFHLRALLEAGVDDAHKAVQKQESKPTIGRRWKLPVAFVGLMLTTVGALGSLAWIAPTDQSPLTGASVPIQRLWLIAILGGAVGSLARALYSFLLDNYAFHYRQITERSSPWAKTVYGIKDDSEMEDDYDPLESWHLYFIKPFLGATLGLLGCRRRPWTARPWWHSGRGKALHAASRDSRPSWVVCGQCISETEGIRHKGRRIEAYAP
jgi:hypothetical protein